MNPRRVPAGVSAGGQFATTTNPRAGLTLDASNLEKLAAAHRAAVAAHDVYRDRYQRLLAAKTARVARTCYPDAVLLTFDDDDGDYGRVLEPDGYFDSAGNEHPLDDRHRAAIADTAYALDAWVDRCTTRNDGLDKSTLDLTSFHLQPGDLAGRNLDSALTLARDEYTEARDRLQRICAQAVTEMVAARYPDAHTLVLFTKTGDYGPFLDPQHYLNDQGDVVSLDDDFAKQLATYAYELDAEVSRCTTWSDELDADTLDLTVSHLRESDLP